MICLFDIITLNLVALCANSIIHANAIARRLDIYNPLAKFMLAIGKIFTVIAIFTVLAIGANNLSKINGGIVGKMDNKLTVIIYFSRANANTVGAIRAVGDSEGGFGAVCVSNFISIDKTFA